MTLFGNDFLDVTPKTQETKEKKIDELDFLEIEKTFVHQRTLSKE